MVKTVIVDAKKEKNVLAKMMIASVEIKRKNIIKKVKIKNVIAMKNVNAVTNANVAIIVNVVIMKQWNYYQIELKN